MLARRSKNSLKTIRENQVSVVENVKMNVRPGVPDDTLAVSANKHVTKTLLSVMLPYHVHPCGNRYSMILVAEYYEICMTQKYIKSEIPVRNHVSAFHS